jgi:DNA-binding response OmpR family regulator
MPKALIVEDEAIIALDLASELEAMGFEIVGFAKSYEGALEFAQRCPPDIAIVDLMLSGAAQGARVAQDLRARGVKVLVVSGDSTAAVEDGGASLIKPWNRADLVKAIGALMASAACREVQPAGGEAGQLT